MLYGNGCIYTCEKILPRILGRKEYGVEKTEPEEDVAEDVTEDPEVSKEPTEGSGEGAAE